MIQLGLSGRLRSSIGTTTQGSSSTPSSTLSFVSAIDLILEDHRDDALRGLPATALRELLAVE